MFFACLCVVCGLKKETQQKNRRRNPQKKKKLMDKLLRKTFNCTNKNIKAKYEIEFFVPTYRSIFLLLFVVVRVKYVCVCECI